MHIHEAQQTQQMESMMLVVAVATVLCITQQHESGALW
jgi:hypothetical protein